jgi:hypothetical protein
MTATLELIREQKLYRLLPGGTRASRLEASGVALCDERTALVAFDNLNQVARVDLSLERNPRNALLPAPSLGRGFEDIAIDSNSGCVFCLIESVEDLDGTLHGFVAEYDAALRFLRCTRLPTRLKKANKGFEGLEHARRGARELLCALCEADGVIEVLSRDTLVAVSDRRKKRQPKRCAEKDQSIHLFRIPRRGAG